MTTITDFPAIRPSLLLDFSNSGRVDPRISCVRASTATCFGSDGRLRTVAANVARLDFSPEAGKCLGLLVEEARTNFLTYSEQFESAAWLASRATISSNAAIAPDGTNTADKLVENTENSAHYAIQAVSLGIGSHTYSVYVKAAERTQASIRFYGTNGAFSQSQSAIFNLATGTVGPVGSDITASIQPVGDGWYRCSATRSVIAAVSVNIAVQTVFNNSETTQGTGTEGIFVWGAQLESGAYPTSYIATTASAATRAADVISMDYTQGGVAGALLADSVVRGCTSPSFVARLHKLSNHYIGAGYASVANMTRSGFVRASSDSAGTAATPSTGGSIAFGNPLRTAISWGGGVFRGAFGGVVSADTAPASVFPDTTKLLLGADAIGGVPKAAMTISRVAVYSKQLTALQLQRLTQL